MRAKREEPTTMFGRKKQRRDKRIDFAQKTLQDSLRLIARAGGVPAEECGLIRQYHLSAAAELQLMAATVLYPTEQEKQTYLGLLTHMRAQRQHCEAHVLTEHTEVGDLVGMIPDTPEGLA